MSLHTPEIVSLLGAPLSGKSSVTHFLVESSIREDFHFVGEAWSYLQPFVADFMIFSQDLSAIECRALIEKTKLKFWRTPIPSDLLNKLQKLYDVNLPNLAALYNFFNLNFLEEIAIAPNLRKIFQRDLLRIQLCLELRTNYFEHQSSRKSEALEKIIVTEGGILSILLYLHDMEFEDFSDILAAHDVPIHSFSDAADLLRTVIYLETLCNLSPALYLQYFYNDVRLDNPDQARLLDSKLRYTLTKSSLKTPVYLFKATTPLMDKAEKIKKILADL